MLCRTHQPQCGSPELRHSPQVPYCSQDSMGTWVTWNHREILVIKTETCKETQSKSPFLVHSKKRKKKSKSKNHIQPQNKSHDIICLDPVRQRGAQRGGHHNWQLLPLSKSSEAAVKQLGSVGQRKLLPSVSVNGLLFSHQSTEVKCVKTHLYWPEAPHWHLLLTAV